MGPFEEYSRRLKSRESQRDVLETQFIRIGNWRLALGILFAFLAWFVFGPHVVSAWVLLIPVLVFVGLAVWHTGVIRRRTVAERAVRFYQDGLDRLQDHWAGRGETGESFRNKEHIYADDLDLFGKGSLFQLLSRARTAMGEQTLASWLLAPASLEEARARQASIKDLASNVDLREDVALIGEDIRAQFDPERMVAWASSSPEAFNAALPWIAAILAVAGVIFGLLFLAGVIPLFPFIATLGCDFAVIYSLRERVNRVLGGIDAPGHDLQILSLMLGRLEHEPRFCEALAIEGIPASKRVARLGRWMDMVDSSDHVLVRAFRPVLLWREQCAFGVDRWRRRNAGLVPVWLRTAGEFEALSSFASLSYERPQWCFPALASDAIGTFSAANLQHPLMPPDSCIPNNVHIGGELRLLIISGSNMSGKSTLLRSVGLASVLAWAGAPVPATALSISRLQLGASIRITDSLQDNRSRFFAEIVRLRHVIDLATSGTCVLFLFDELLSGTNSHDRRIGAGAVVKGLIEAGAIGLITTHDLALADIEQDLDGKACNAHFEDQIIDGEMRFDYKLRPGVVTHSNALELMRAVGLIV